jgi:photosystem II stability/assembly factor-like uncharacterized protein
MTRTKGITLVIAAVAVLAVGSTWAITSMSSEPRYQTSMMGANSAFDSVSADMGMEHIHNLMLTDSNLLIGTHEGLWSQSLGQPAKRIGSSHFDVMGLSMVNGAMVASGHPGTGEDNVNDLGLRTSMNGGMAWNNTSLFGKVDFHRLATSGKTVMGISAHDGALMRSEDAGKSWRTLTNPGIYDLAMDPTDSKMVIGTTQQGVLMSVDGGKSFALIAKAPVVSLVSWDKSRLVGVTPVGEVYLSLDMGSTWKKISAVPGEPMALSVKGDQIAILAGTTVYYSSDAGITFKERIVGVLAH